MAASIMRTLEIPNWFFLLLRQVGGQVRREVLTFADFQCVIVVGSSCSCVSVVKIFIYGINYAHVILNYLAVLL